MCTRTMMARKEASSSSAERNHHVWLATVLRKLRLNVELTADHLMCSFWRRSLPRGRSWDLSETTPALACVATGTAGFKNSPYMRVYYTEESLKNWDGGVLKGTDQDLYLGKVHDPYHCCNLTLETFDDENKKDYYISGSCCQCGLYCHWPCGPC